MSESIYGVPVVSMSGLGKPKEGRFKKAYNEAKSSIGRGFRLLNKTETSRERADRLSRKQRRNAIKSKADMLPFGGGKRKRRKTQRKPKRTRRTKRRTRKSRR